jgi:dipeptidyl aminopeptidase/acylaminoacyl peptidase
VYRAAELGYIDLERVGIAGQSFGGYGTAAIVSHTNLFRAAVAISGIYDLPGIYGDIRPDGSAFWIGWSEGGQARMGTHPWANLRRYVDNSPYYQADNGLRCSSCMAMTTWPITTRRKCSPPFGGSSVRCSSRRITGRDMW